MGYALCEGLSYCRVLDSYIFLDLSRDRYFCLGDDAAAAFAALVSGEAPSAGSTEVAELRELCADGILLPVAADVWPMPVETIAARRSIRNEHNTVRAPRVVEALSRRLAAEFSLRTRGIRGCVARARDIAKRALPSPDAHEAAAASASFAASMLWRSRAARCVSISLATLEWFAARGRGATLVVGVKLHPFEAHCWVQVGDLLINDEIDQVRPFVPILAV